MTREYYCVASPSDPSQALFRRKDNRAACGFLGKRLIADCQKFVRADPEATQIQRQMRKISALRRLHRSCWRGRVVVRRRAVRRK